jgi:thiol-disulfide isomerase/thioredoxin
VKEHLQHLRPEIELFMALPTIVTARVRACCLLSMLFCTAPASSVADTPVPSESIATLAAVAGDSIPLEGRVVYLDFWASWCGPCRSSFPWMQALLAKYHDRGLEIVTVNLDRDPAAGRKFLRDMQCSLPVLFDPKGSLAKQYGLEAMPTAFVYRRDGKLGSRHEGFHPKESAALESLIATLLQEEAPK